MSGMSMLLLLLLFILPTLGSEDLESIAAKKEREKRVFSLFNVIQFKNEPCTSTASLNGGRSNRMGVCFTNTECAGNRGTVQGTCASGFGVCCVFLVTSGDRPISQNCTYVQNPSFPRALTDAQTVTYTVRKAGSDVCFLKLNFEMFKINGLSGTLETDAQCPTDTFIVTTSTNQRVPVICGENTGQHMILDLGANADETASLAFTLVGARSNRMWDIKLSQVACASRAAPPNGCLQYQTGRSGRLMTFNFRAPMESHLPNQQYQVCQNVDNAFTLSGEVGGGKLALQDDDCAKNDFVGISLSSSICQQGDNLATKNRYCGMFLSDQPQVKKMGVASAGGSANLPICDCTSPFVVEISTNKLSDVTGGKNTKLSKGLCLDWMQVPCNG